MRRFFDPRQLLHAPARELHNGGYTAYAETPARAEAILATDVAAAGVPTVIVMEGGYAVDALGANVASFLSGF